MLIFLSPCHCACLQRSLPFISSKGTTKMSCPGYNVMAKSPWGMALKRSGQHWLWYKRKFNPVHYPGCIESAFNRLKGFTASQFFVYSFPCQSHTAMKKSDIILTVVMREDNSKSEQQVREEITSVLLDRSLDINQWDQPVTSPIGNALIKNFSSCCDRHSVKYLIQDMDLILKRIS